MKKIFILSAICALLCSCGSEKKVEGNVKDLYGEWIIEQVNGLGTEGGMKQPFINFAADGKVNGNASVNSFFGAYELRGDTLKMGNLGMTRMMGPSMDVEDAIVKVLGEAVTISVKKDVATVMDKEGNAVMKLRKK